jgi:hypothetical protein
MKIKRIIKVIFGLFIFFTLPSLLFFGFIYLKYNQELPTGKTGPEADELAWSMLEALNYSAYESTDYLEWTFRGKHRYKWYKTDGICEVSWDQLTVILDLKDQKESKVFVAGKEYKGIEKIDYINKAESFFNNDSFWLVAPYKLFDKGVERRLVRGPDNEELLLVTYTSGGNTPGDSYLWHMDESGKPVRFQMWVSILPIKGLGATWEGWTITESGAALPTFHKLLFFGMEMGEVKGLNL